MDSNLAWVNGKSGR